MARLKPLSIPAPLLTQIILVTICVVGGLLIASQWQAQTTRVVNPVQPYTSLTDTRDALVQEQNNLKGQIEQLNKSIDDRARALATAQQVDGQLVSSTDRSSLTAGLIAVQGKGLVITLDDSQRGSVSDQAIAHAADLRDLISLLRSGGAEAISINDERVVATTAIDCIVNTILVNQTRLTNPFVLKVIGDQTTLSNLVNDPNIMQDLHRRVLTDGVIFKVESKSNVVIAAYSGTLPGLTSPVKSQ